MKTLQTTEPMLVLGIALRTRNGRAFEDIPRHWQRLGSENWLARIPNRADGDVYAVYPIMNMRVWTTTATTR